MENPIKMDDMGGALFWETTIREQDGRESDVGCHDVIHGDKENGM